MAFKIKDYKCLQCGSDLFYAEELKTVKGTVGLYCEYCGAWRKWLNKNEKQLIKRGEANELDNI